MPEPGAKYVTFFESDGSAVDRLKRNIATLGVGNRSRVVGSDLFKWFDSARAMADIDVIFLDPPYRFLQEKTDQMQKLAAAIHGHLPADGIVIFRHDAENSITFSMLPVAEARNYGSMTLEFLRPLTTNITYPTTDK